MPGLFPTAGQPSALSSGAPESVATLTPGESQPGAANSDPRQLMGLGGGAVATLLGQPGFRRHDDPAEVWQYVSAGCALNVFLYHQGGDFRVAYYEIRPRDGREAGLLDERTCFAKLLRPTHEARSN